jgi:hypothetical protein
MNLEKVVAQNTALSFACFAGSLGLLALAYPMSRDAGDIAVWLTALVVLLLAWRLGGSIPRDRSILAAFVGVGLATLWWSGMYVFVAWYRFDFLRNADVGSWGDYARLHNTIGMAVNAASATSAVLGSLSGGRSKNGAAR